MASWTDVFWKLVVGPVQFEGGVRHGRVNTIVAVGGAAVAGAGLTYWWVKLPEARRQELLAKGTDAVIAAFSGRKKKTLPVK